MVDPEELYGLLPPTGEYLAFEAARAALSEHTGCDISENELAQCIFALGAMKVDWLPTEAQVRRSVPGQGSQPPEQIREERDLEPWFERYLWLGAREFYDPPPKSLSVVVENTARTHAGNGRWTRPDLSMACVSRYRFQAVPQFDLYSFELKMPAGCNMLAVHEALAHTAAAHFAYLGLYLPNGSAERSNLPSMLEQAQRHGVGVIRFQDPMDISSFDRLLEARRCDTAPAHIDGFIEDRFSRANNLALRRWVRL